MALPSRKIIRLQDFDYSSNGAYFVTVCTQGTIHRFWKEALSPTLNEAGEMILSWIARIPKQFPGIHLAAYAIMPNHIHLVLQFHNADVPLCDVMYWLKSITTHMYSQGVKIGRYVPYHKKLWQRSYYEHIVRNEQDFLEVCRYVIENPSKWQLDKLCLK